MWSTPPREKLVPGEVNRDTNGWVVTIEAEEVSTFAKNESHSSESTLRTIWLLANKNKIYATRLLILTCEL